MADLRLFLLSVITLVFLHGACAVEYEVINNTPGSAGGIRFDSEIGIPFTKKILGTINEFIWNVFQEQTPSDRKNVPLVRVVIEEYTGPAGFVIYESIINVSAPFLQSVQGDIRWEFTSLLYHEMTHVFQWTGNYTTPRGLIEGFAEYVKLKANYIHPETYTKPGQGDTWDEGYGPTARFLEYCESLSSGFVTTLNKKMRYAYSNQYFVELLGKPVEQLWSEYKNNYGSYKNNYGNYQSNALCLKHNVKRYNILITLIVVIFTLTIA
ncbi:hypothetical protein LguiB_021965 [Lonicera macranthoides]